MTRQDWLLVALGALAVASLLGSVAAWVALWRHRRSPERGRNHPAP